MSFVIRTAQADRDRVTVNHSGDWVRRILISVFVDGLLVTTAPVELGDTPLTPGTLLELEAKPIAIMAPGPGPGWKSS